jgi:DNA polymerase-3 subunit epsilon
VSIENNQSPEWAQRLAVFDLETTGLVLSEARIVTACVAEIDVAGQVIGNASEWMADPGIEIPEAAAAVHGVTTEIARSQGRAAAEVVSEIVETLRAILASGTPVVAYNAPYDFSILHFEALRHGIAPLEAPSPVIDPLVIDKVVDKWRKGPRNLEATALLYGVGLDSAHNATADAVAAGRVAQALAKKYGSELSVSAAELHDLQVGWSAANDESYETFRRKTDPNFSVQRGWPLKF